MFEKMAFLPFISFFLLSLIATAGLGWRQKYQPSPRTLWLHKWSVFGQALSVSFLVVGVEWLVHERGRLSISPLSAIHAVFILTWIISFPCSLIFNGRSSRVIHRYFAYPAVIAGIGAVVTGTSILIFCF